MKGSPCKKCVIKVTCSKAYSGENACDDFIKFSIKIVKRYRALNINYIERGLHE